MPPTGSTGTLGEGAHTLPRFDDGTATYQPPLNTPAPNVPLVSHLYTPSGHQSHQLRGPPKVFHQGLSPPPPPAFITSSSSSSSNFNDGDSIPHFPPLAAAAAATAAHHAGSPSNRGLSYILNPAEEENQIGDPNPNMYHDVNPNTVS